MLEIQDVRVDAVIVNRIIPDSVTDPYFGKWKDIQKEHLAAVHESFEPVPILTSRDRGRAIEDDEDEERAGGKPVLLPLDEHAFESRIGFVAGIGGHRSHHHPSFGRIMTRTARGVPGSRRCDRTRKGLAETEGFEPPIRLLTV